MVKKVVKQELRGFADFIRSKGVIGLAIGIIIGTVVTATVQSLVNDMINPILGLLLDADELSQATIMLGGAELRWGNFLSALLDLIIIAAVVYFGVKWLR
ncbi:MAG: MscL family protein, partial [Candidatus Saccharimonadales bacterium]